MLTINFNIKDEQLAQRLVEKAEANGKSVDLLVRESLADLFGESDESDFFHFHLDVREHAYVINNVLTSEE